MASTETTSPTLKTKSSKFGDSDGIHEIEIMTILARKKLNKSDISRDLDFMLFHSEFQRFSILESPNWQLYSITLNYAYFVEMPFPSTEYTFKYCDSLSEGLFTEAQRVARVDWNTFEIKSDKWRHFNGKVIALTTMLNSGSSTLCSLLQQVANEAPNPDSLIIYSNPDPFTHLAGFCEMYEKIGVKQTRKMLLTTLRYLCKDQILKQTIIFRLRPSTIRLVPHLHSVAPHVMHVFMARDQLEHSISLFVNSKSDEQSF
uniref:Uncharacterized protein n=1 Tax=Panagrolaimus superbus TaxID=310955 RepID=A0A914Y471_9BILA